MNILNLEIAVSEQPYDVILKSILADAYTDASQYHKASFQHNLIKLINKEIDTLTLLQQCKSISIKEMHQLAQIDSPFMPQFFNWWLSKKKNQPSRAFSGIVITGYIINHVVDNNVIYIGSSDRELGITKNPRFNYPAYLADVPDIRHLARPAYGNVYLQGQDKTTNLSTIRIIPNKGVDINYLFKGVECPACKRKGRLGGRVCQECGGIGWIADTAL